MVERDPSLPRQPYLSREAFIPLHLWGHCRLPGPIFLYLCDRLDRKAEDHILMLVAQTDLCAN